MARARDARVQHQYVFRKPYENGYGTSLPRSNYKDVY